MNFPNRKRRTSAEAWEELRQELMKEKNHIDRRRWNKEADEQYHDGKYRDYNPAAGVSEFHHRKQQYEQ